jgi:ABC-type amino acid transport substrate-binding protein
VAPSGLLAKSNAGLAAIRADGTWQQINNRWAVQ